MFDITKEGNTFTVTASISLPRLGARIKEMFDVSYTYPRRNTVCLTLTALEGVTLGDLVIDRDDKRELPEDEGYITVIHGVQVNAPQDRGSLFVYESHSPYDHTERIFFLPNVDAEGNCLFCDNPDCAGNCRIVDYPVTPNGGPLPADDDNDDEEDYEDSMEAMRIYDEKTSYHNNYDDMEDPFANE